MLKKNGIIYIIDPHNSFFQNLFINIFIMKYLTQNQIGSLFQKIHRQIPIKLLRGLFLLEILISSIPNLLI